MKIRCFCIVLIVSGALLTEVRQYRQWCCRDAVFAWTAQ
nr:small toxic inner membrane protein TimP [Escherichia coli]